MTGTLTTDLDPRNPSTIRSDDGLRVDVWATRVDDPRDRTASFALLDAGERHRASRFRFQRDRDRFIERRAFRRRVLAGYLDVAPSDLTFASEPFGKPALAPASRVRFNASHSDGLAVIAVTAAPSVGIDIERRRPIEDALGLAESHFARPELRRLQAIPEASRSDAFLAIWTRKESIVKAIGAGLSVPLDRFDATVVDDDGVGRPGGPWGDLALACIGIDGLDGYVGAVTVEGTSVEVRYADVGAIAA